MPALTQERRKAAARKAAFERHRGPDHPNTRFAARDLRAAELAEHIERIVDAAPPLTPEQRDRLALLLRGGAPPGSNRQAAPSPGRIGRNAEGQTGTSGGAADAA